MLCPSASNEPPDDTLLKLTVFLEHLCGASFTSSGRDSFGSLSFGESKASVASLSRSMIHQVVIEPLPCQKEKNTFMQESILFIISTWCTYHNMHLHYLKLHDYVLLHNTYVHTCNTLYVFVLLMCNYL